MSGQRDFTEVVHPATAIWTKSIPGTAEFHGSATTETDPADRPAFEAKAVQVASRLRVPQVRVRVSGSEAMRRAIQPTVVDGVLFIADTAAPHAGGANVDGAVNAAHIGNMTVFDRPVTVAGTTDLDQLVAAAKVASGPLHDDLVHVEVYTLAEHAEHHRGRRDGSVRPPRCPRAGEAKMGGPVASSATAP
jgi:hypothetical protein